MLPMNNTIVSYQLIVFSSFDMSPMCKVSRQGSVD